MTTESNVVYSNGRKIGWMNERVFRKVISGSKHIHQKMNAIGIDADKFEYIIAPQCDQIRVLDRETQTVYSTTPDTFSEKGMYRHFKPFGAQIFLALKHWEKTKK